MTKPKRAPPRVETPWRRALLAWYDRHRRRLPWRERPTPYRVWISEIMLQQTQVAAVLPYYARFLRRLPSVAALAKARESEVLRLWAGLGYYSRARNLLKAARRIQDRHGGRFPEEPDAVLALPGIGRYSSAAIRSIAFGQRAALVDGNVARLFARLFAWRDDPRSPRFMKRAWARAEGAIDPRRPGDWNQALMELGARVCVPETPRCERCPLTRWCLARRKGWQERLPRSRRSRERVELRWTALWIQERGRVLLWRRAAEERFLPGHWSLPESRHLGAAAELGERLGEVRHAITHHRIAVELRRARLRGERPPLAAWARRDALEGRLVSSLWRKAAALGRLSRGPVENRYDAADRPACDRQEPAK